MVENGCTQWLHAHDILSPNGDQIEFISDINDVSELVVQEAGGLAGRSGSSPSAMGGSGCSAGAIAALGKNKTTPWGGG